jgi:hypothetical protein
MENLNITHYLTVNYGRTGNCKLTAAQNCAGYAPQKYNAGGGGYDKLGTVLASYVMANFAEEVKQLAIGKPDGYIMHALYNKGGKVSIQGAAGYNAVAEVAREIGLGIARTSVDTDNRSTFIVYRSEPRFLYPYITNLNFCFDKYAIEKEAAQNV